MTPFTGPCISKNPFLCPCVFMTPFPGPCISKNPFLCPCVFLTLFLSVPVSLYFCFFLSLCLCPCVSLSLFRSVPVSLYLGFFVPVSLYLCFSLSLCLSTSVSLSLCLYISFSILLPPHAINEFFWISMLYSFVSNSVSSASFPLYVCLHSMHLLYCRLASVYIL